MSKMPTDRNRRHEELLRRVGMPVPANAERERNGGEDQGAPDPLRPLLPKGNIPGPPKPRVPKSRD